MTDNIIDIQTKKPIEPEMPEDVTISQWLNIWKRHVKEYKATAISIIGVYEDGETFNDMIAFKRSDLHGLFYETEYLKDRIKDTLDPSIEIDLEDDE